jgi:hypothetical protein
MVKTKGGRLLNPADAFRKEQRKKEVARNKMERKFIREGAKLRSEPDTLKKELQDLISMEDSGALPKNLKLKKKALQEAYDQAIKRQKVGRTWVQVSLPECSGPWSPLRHSSPARPSPGAQPPGI